MLGSTPSSTDLPEPHDMELQTHTAPDTTLSPRLAKALLISSVLWVALYLLAKWYVPDGSATSLRISFWLSRVSDLAICAWISVAFLVLRSWVIGREPRKVKGKLLTAVVDVALAGGWMLVIYEFLYSF